MLHQSRRGPSTTLWLAVLLTSIVGTPAWAEAPVRYVVDLDGRDHHEAAIEVTFSDLPAGDLAVRMSRTSPGRYALHEFVKNVYAVSAVDGSGRDLDLDRPDLHEWRVSGHDGTVVFRYTLFGDLSDGTYTAIDSSHAHLNIPASFVWAKGLETRAVVVEVDSPEGWAVHTQLERSPEGTFRASDLAEFLDSPIEVSDAWTTHWPAGPEGGEKTIELVLHHLGDDSDAEALAEATRRIVDEQWPIFGELPALEHGRYTFLIDALPWSDWDGMEHRNSTVITVGGSVAESIESLLGTISHELVHAWLVERLRPASLEPFDFESANVSEELWFAEGFTSYYSRLILARAGLLDEERFAEALARWVDVVVRSPGTDLRSAAEMSARAPFVDAAVANEPTNRVNTFVSYYTYGAALGLALDLTLRSETDHDLDDFMRLAWQRFGRDEIPFDNEDLRGLLAELGGRELAGRFFEGPIFGTELPPYEALLDSVGFRLRAAAEHEAWLGGVRLETARTDDDEPGLRVDSMPRRGTPLFDAGIGRGDLLLVLAGSSLGTPGDLEAALGELEPGDEVELEVEKRGARRTVDVELAGNPKLEIVTFEATGEVPDVERLERRNAWLASLAPESPTPRRYCPITGQPHPFRNRFCPAHGERLEITQPQ